MEWEVLIALTNKHPKQLKKELLFELVSPEGENVLLDFQIISGNKRRYLKNHR